MCYSIFGELALKKAFSTGFFVRMIPVFHGTKKNSLLLTLTAKATTPWRAGFDVRLHFSELTTWRFIRIGYQRSEKGLRKI